MNINFQKINLIINILQLVTLGFIAASLGFATKLLLSSQSAPHYRVEVIAPDDSSFSREISEMGMKGWKPVTCRRARGEYDDFSYECIVVKKTSTWELQQELRK